MPTDNSGFLFVHRLAPKRADKFRPLADPERQEVLIRLQLGMSIVDIARQTGFSEPTIRKIRDENSSQTETIDNNINGISTLAGHTEKIDKPETQARPSPVTLFPGRVFSPKQNKRPPEPISAEKRAEVYSCLEKTNGAIAETVRRTGISDKTVMKINRERLAELAGEQQLAANTPVKGKRKSKKLGAKKKKTRRSRYEALLKAIRTEGADIPAVVEQFGLSPKYAIMIQGLVVGQRRTDIHNHSGFNIATIQKWARRLQVPSKIDTAVSKRATVIYELSHDGANLKDIARKTNLHIRRIWAVIAQTGMQSRYRPNPKEITIGNAIKRYPHYSNKQIAVHLHDEVNFNYVGEVRRRLDESLDKLPAGMVQEKLFMDAAIELARRHLQTEDGRAQFAEIKAGVKRDGFMPALEAKNPWPTSNESFPGCSLPRYRLLDALLTYHLKKAEISGPADLIDRTKAGFVQLEKLPLQIFQALHFVLAAQDVTFDRLKIQHGYHQTWLPSRSQMIKTAKQVLGCKR